LEDGALLPVCGTNGNVYTNRLSKQQLAFIQQEQCDDLSPRHGRGKERVEKTGRECKENTKNTGGSKSEKYQKQRNS
jgi:hypothetical protein